MGLARLHIWFTTISPDVSNIVDLLTTMITDTVIPYLSYSSAEIITAILDFYNFTLANALSVIIYHLCAILIAYFSNMTSNVAPCLLSYFLMFYTLEQSQEYVDNLVKCVFLLNREYKVDSNILVFITPWFFCCIPKDPTAENTSQMERRNRTWSGRCQKHIVLSTDVGQWRMNVV